MGTSLSNPAHKKDIDTFLRYADELTQQALGVSMDAQMKSHILATNRFLPMKPQADVAAVDRHTLRKKLGQGFITILGRSNKLAGGTAYMIRFTVYPDERWSNRMSVRLSSSDFTYRTD
jgi:GMP synthase PP-ATPase subunit